MSPARDASMSRLLARRGRRAQTLTGSLRRRCFSAATAPPIPNFDELAVSMPLHDVAKTFNSAFGMGFAAAATRRAMLEGMRASYCRKLLSERAVQPEALARLHDPMHLPSREEVLAALGLDSAAPAVHGGSHAAANVEPASRQGWAGPACGCRRRRLRRGIGGRRRCSRGGRRRGGRWRGGLRRGRV